MEGGDFLLKSSGYEGKLLKENIEGHRKAKKRPEDDRRTEVRNLGEFRKGRIFFLSLLFFKNLGWKKLERRIRFMTSYISNLKCTFRSSHYFS